MKSNIFLTIFFISLTSFISAQEEFNFIPKYQDFSFINPAFAGKLNSDNQFILATIDVGYKQQWALLQNAFSSQYAKISIPFIKMKNVPDSLTDANKKLGVNLSYLQNNFSLLKQQQFKIDFSFNIKISESNFLFFGINFGYFWQMINISELNSFSPLSNNMKNIFERKGYIITGGGINFKHFFQNYGSIDIGGAFTDYSGNNFFVYNIAPDTNLFFHPQHLLINFRYKHLSNRLTNSLILERPTKGLFSPNKYRPIEISFYNSISFDLKEQFKLKFAFVYSFMTPQKKIYGNYNGIFNNQYYDYIVNFYWHQFALAYAFGYNKDLYKYGGTHSVSLKYYLKKEKNKDLKPSEDDDDIF